MVISTSEIFNKKKSSGSLIGIDLTLTLQQSDIHTTGLVCVVLISKWLSKYHGPKYGEDE